MKSLRIKRKVSEISDIYIYVYVQNEKLLYFKNKIEIYQVYQEDDGVMQGYGKCWRILAGTFPVKSCGTLFWVGVGGGNDAKVF